MAPYISSHPSDSVWLAPPANGAHWDILKNLVANTRSQQSTPAQVPAFPGWHPGGGSCPAEMKTSARSMGQCVEG